MPAREVISSYHDLWHVEQSFRMSKTDLAARPMFHHTHQAIEAHLTIVFAALALARTVQMRTGLAIRNVVRQLRPLRSATIAINAALQTGPGKPGMHVAADVMGKEKNLAAAVLLAPLAGIAAGILRVAKRAKDAVKEDDHA